MSLKHAILGFLSFQPMSGYDLKKVFDRSVRHFWPANQSQIYRSLAELKEQGFVEPDVIEREDRLDMKIYHCTALGQEELHRWLSTQLPHREYREAFLIQVYFAGMLSDDEVMILLRREIRDLEETQEQFNIMYQMYREKMTSQNAARGLFFSILPLEYGIESNQKDLEWLNSILRRLETGDYSLKDLII